MKHYSTLGAYTNGFIIVIKNDKFGFMDENKKLICKIKYDDVWFFDTEGFCAVSINGKWGYINTKGEELCKFKYTLLELRENKFKIVKIQKLKNILT